MDTVEIYPDGKGEWRWKFIHQNGSVMADGGEGYKRPSDCVHGVKYVLGFTHHDTDRQVLTGPATNFREVKVVFRDS